MAASGLADRSDQLSGCKQEIDEGEDSEISSDDDVPELEEDGGWQLAALQDPS